MGLTREQIIQARAGRKPHRLEVPEWGGPVFVRVLSAADQMRLSDGKPEEMPVRVLLDCLVREDGEKVFTEDDFDLLAGEDFPIVMRVFTFAARVNGLSTAELEAAMASFAPTPDASSSTE